MDKSLIKYFLFIFLFFFLFSNAKNLLCGEEQIDHCMECGIGELNDTCSKCEDNYFLFLFNYLCLPCDHLVYGDSGCKGICSIDDNLDVTCDEFGCKKGYFNIDKKTCVPCSYTFNSLGCSDCSYLPPSGKTALETNERIFKCNSCLDNRFKFQNEKCVLCKKENCSSCYYIENSDKKICDKCHKDFYLREGECVKCWRKNISNGICEVCTDDPTDYQNFFCRCYGTYTLDSRISCKKCPDRCLNCTYDFLESRTKCVECSNNNILNSKGDCIYCGAGCLSCSLNKNDEPLCSQCDSGFSLIEGKCKNCPQYCEKCHLENDTFICDKCRNYYTLSQDNACIKCPEQCVHCEITNNSQKFECTKCAEYNNYAYALNNKKLCEVCPNKCKNCLWKDDLNNFVCTECDNKLVLYEGDCLKCSDTELGESCKKCNYNITEKKFQCYSCIDESYAYLINKKECIYNNDPTNSELYGCLQGVYNETKSRYECIDCRKDYVTILNEKKCNKYENLGLKSHCPEANNIGNESNPIYSCTYCKYDYIAYVNVKDYRGALNCYEPVDELKRCYTAFKDINGNLQCTECRGNYKLEFNEIYNKLACSENCLPDSYKKGFLCYKCDYGNSGCIPEKGCEYFNSNGQLNCKECKIGYFNYTYGKCLNCNIGDPKCKECHLNETANKFECDKCIEGYLVNKEKKCELNTCEEHSEVNYGCIICKKNLLEYINEKKCDNCTKNYFLTKNNTCLFCKSKNIGGPGCELCGYVTDNNGNETNDIICKHCPKGILTPDGKCYKCHEVLENCETCEYNNENKKFYCTKCQQNKYFLNSTGHCIYNFYNSYDLTIPLCEYQINYHIIDNYNIKTSSYCKICLKGYYPINNTCVPFSLLNCSLSSFFIFNSSYNETEEQNKLRKELYYECYYSDNVKINYYYNEIGLIKTENGDFEIGTIRKKLNIEGILFNENYNIALNDDIMNIFSSGYLCLNNSGTGEKYSPKKFKIL